ncbi:60S ribosomal export protein NMD3 [Elysia marginata]|uniref:60S ribosomal export protein NMD3 n=1 Tax=Elysia marginata TaxID=1093978 RepID=A0AAV4H2T9_9GAST|nr:60S ribosomal export protein NMD3 [Elysia marginata]
MEYLDSGGGSSNVRQQQYSLICCCRCGLQIEPNPTNMCVNCLRSDVDITDGIPKTSALSFCKSCERYLQPPNQWVKATLESRELLSVCLKKLKGLNKVKLVDAGFVWTEPHSMRIKVKLTVQKEVMNGAVLEQAFVVEFVVQPHMCDECHRVEAKDFWRAVVQVRQKCDHKKTFFYLEQLILKHRAHRNTVNIKPMADGLDFFFSKQDDAKKIVEFLSAYVPSRSLTGMPEQPQIPLHGLADVYVARMSDLGVNDQQFHCRTHLGYLLRTGDTVLGFDFTNANLNHAHFDKLKGDKIPDVMLVKKVFDRSKRLRRRKWRLERFDGADELDTESVTRDYNDFLDDLEEDQAIRENVNIYKDPTKLSVEEDTDDEGAPQISLQEMLEDLHISEDATGGEGAPMME